MKTHIAKIGAPLVGVFLMMMGSNLFSTLVPLRLNSQHFSLFYIGLVAATYYCGMFIGSFHVEKFIARVGYVRAFSAFISLLSISFLTAPLVDTEVAWVSARFANGFGLAGLYVIAESWLLAASTPQNRGQYLSFYSIALSLGGMSGQQLLQIGDPQTLVPFCLAALALSCATLPFSVVKSKAPHLEGSSPLSIRRVYAKSPLGFHICLLSGVLLSTMSALFPIVFQNQGMALGEIAKMLTACQAGGFLMQYPVGWLSDRLNRLWVVVLLLSVLAFASMLFLWVGQDPILSLVASFLYGAAVICLYPVGMSYACSFFSAQDVTKATQGLVLSYSLGAMMGPLLGVQLLQTSGNVGLFTLTAVLSGLFGVYALWFGRSREKYFEESVISD
jgi:MFS family permease